MLERVLHKYKDAVVIVEGKKDLSSLEYLGFTRVFTIHHPSVPLRERVLQLREKISKRERVCILTDFDRKGKQLYELLKTLFQEQGLGVNTELRSLVRRTGVVHVEGLHTYLER